MIYLRFLTNLNRIKVFITDCDQLRSLNQPNIFEISANSFIHLYEKTFRVKCDSSSLNFSLESFFDDTLLDKQEGEDLPISSEILSDSIFCHGHYTLNDEHNLSQRTLDSFGQIIRMCRNASAQSKILLESRCESLGLIIIHPDFLIGNIRRIETENTIMLRRVSFVFYKYLDPLQNFTELATLRHSFAVEWYPVSNDLFGQLKEKLNYSNDYEVSQVEKSSEYIESHLRGYSVGFL